MTDKRYKISDRKVKWSSKQMLTKHGNGWQSITMADTAQKWMT
jgi:hypothetical protein